MPIIAEPRRRAGGKGATPAARDRAVGTKEHVHRLTFTASPLVGPHHGHQHDGAALRIHPQGDEAMATGIGRLNADQARDAFAPERRRDWIVPASCRRRALATPG